MSQNEQSQPSPSAVSFLAKAWASSPEGLRILDKNGLMLDVNDMFCRMVGKSHSELVGAPFYIVFAEDSWQERERSRRECFASGTIEHLSVKEYELWDGRRFWFDVTHVFSEDAHEPGVLLSIFRDVTAKKQVEEQARIATERYRIMFEKIEDVYFETALDGTIIEVSPSIENYYRYSRSGLIGKQILDFYKDRELRIKFLDALRRDGAVSNFEISFGSEPGPYVPCSVNAQLLFSDSGVPLKICGFISDLTDRKKHEQKIREQNVLWEALAKHLPFELWVRDRDSRVIFQNEQSIAHWGSQIGKTIDEQQELESLHGLWRENNRRALSGEVAVGEVNYQHGEALRHYHQIVAPLRDGEAISGSVGMNIDITQQRALESQLLQAQKLEGLGTLAGGIAHDFNNLLSMILGSAELLRARVKGDEKMLKHIERIIESSERGASISRQLLLFSRPDQVKLEPLSVSHIILQVEELLRHFLPKDIAVTTHIAIDNGIIMGESGHIHQALLNLAINARDAMANGGLLRLEALSVSGADLRRTIPGAGADEYVAIKVTDTGVGMDSETLQKIYNPFFTTKEPGKGTGLGLAIVHGIVKSHHGFMHVESEPGNGTSFSIYLPAIDRTAQTLPVPAEYQDAERGTVLLVDDEDLIREVLYDALEAAGYTVLAAQDGAEGLRMYSQFMDTIALVITDIGMPKMSGSIFIKKLKEINPQVKVIVSSGFMDASVRDQMSELGVADILAKPYKFSTIHAAVRKALG